MGVRATSAILSNSVITRTARNGFRAGSETSNPNSEPGWKTPPIIRFCLRLCFYYFLFLGRRACTTVPATVVPSSAKRHSLTRCAATQECGCRLWARSPSLVFAEARSREAPEAFLASVVVSWPALTLGVSVASAPLHITQCRWATRVRVCSFARSRSAEALGCTSREGRNRFPRSA